MIQLLGGYINSNLNSKDEKQEGELGLVTGTEATGEQRFQFTSLVFHPKI